MPGSRLYYIGFISIFYLFWLVFKIGGVANIEQAIASSVIDIAVCIIAMLLTVYILLPKFFYTQRYGVFTSLFSGIIFIGGSIIILLQLELYGSSLSAYRVNVARSNHYFYWFWSDLIFGSYFLVFMIATGGAAIRFAFDRLQALNHVKQLEKEKLQTELDRLKNQINPHFLFNALNTIYYKIDRANQPARETLQQFSKMLRYQLYECEGPSIKIEQELRFLLSYIELQKERMNDNYRIDYKGFEEVTGLFIAPFLLLPIVENCFKHVSQWPDRGNDISIECCRKENTFLFRTSNSRVDMNGQESGGIGLKNIQKQMELIYPGLYQLEIKQTPERFELTLQLELVMSRI
ncbi:MAG TPA: histidine kinase [Chitinophagaceae bacterium]|nr:histidine kinase [Chitinophagaceae bacterium]